MDDWDLLMQELDKIEEEVLGHVVGQQTKITVKIKKTKKKSKKTKTKPPNKQKF